MSFPVSSKLDVTLRRVPLFHSSLICKTYYGIMVQTEAGGRLKITKLLLLLYVVKVRYSSESWLEIRNISNAYWIHLTNVTLLKTHFPYPAIIGLLFFSEQNHPKIYNDATRMPPMSQTNILQPS